MASAAGSSSSSSPMRSQSADVTAWTTAADNAAKRQRSGSMSEGGILTFAVPKKGRLYEHCADLLKGCGLRYQRNPRLDIAVADVYGRNAETQLKIKLVFLPAHDIASFVGEGNVDLGITGQDMIAETGCTDKVAELAPQTGFGVCSLALQAPKVAHIQHPSELCGKRVATSFPNLSRRFFENVIEEHFQATGVRLSMPSIRTISGSVEAACGLGLADCVIDLVETGATMEEAGLEKIAEVIPTQAVLIANPHSQHQKVIEIIRKRVEGYLLAKKYSMMYYNVKRADLARAEKITPGKKAPTISPLDDPDWVSVGAMVPSNAVSEIMDQLQEIGATDMFIVSIENCRT